MQNLIKLKLVGLGHNKIGYNPKGLMNWLNKENNIIFITTLKLIDSNIFIQNIREYLIVPCIINYEDYLKIKKQYGGLPIALERCNTKYSKWLKSIKFYDFIKQNNIEFNINQKYWYIYPNNYKSIKKIGFELIEKSIKIKKIKI